MSNRLTKLDVKDFYCSPLGRAKDTASFTLKKLGRTATELDWLREFEGKVFQGLRLRQSWDLMPSYWTKEDKYYDSSAWLDTKLMRGTNVKREYKKVCNGIDELLSKYGYEHTDRYYKVTRPNHDTIVLFCHFAVECVILSHIFATSPMVLWHNFVALPISVTTLVTEEREKGLSLIHI